MKITKKGQVTIPWKIRKKYGFIPQTEVEFIEEKDGVRLIKKKETSSFGKKVVQHLRSKGTIEMSTDKIMALTRSD